MVQSILVTGATGTIGQEVVKALLKKDVQVKVGVRNTDKIKNQPWINQVEITTLDYDQPDIVGNLG